jgi:hypothetical protein
MSSSRNLPFIQPLADSHHATGQPESFVGIVPATSCDAGPAARGGVAIILVRSRTAE